jgi:hypothetical protein
MNFLYIPVHNKNIFITGHTAFLRVDEFLSIKNERRRSYKFACITVTFIPAGELSFLMIAWS